MRQISREIFLLISNKIRIYPSRRHMVTALIEHKRTEEEFLILAQAKEIADNSFRPAAGMIAAQPELAVLCKVNTYHREIVQIVSTGGMDPQSSSGH